MFTNATQCRDKLCCSGCWLWGYASAVLAPVWIGQDAQAHHHLSWVVLLPLQMGVLLPTSLVMHDFWNFAPSSPAHQIEFSHFIKVGP
jgi:hypothetical protein